MERIKNLGRYQKGVLLLLIVLILFFAVLYAITIPNEGYAYKNALLIPRQENGVTSYSGELEGNPAVFTVSADKTVVFQYGDTVYGPYTIKEDATAIPKNNQMGNAATGIELRCGEEVIFRGSAVKIEDYWWLSNEDGTTPNTAAYAVTINGITKDENGNIIDPMEPSVSTLLELMNDPALTHKGSWIGWFCGVLMCVIGAIVILFADELFYLRLSLKVRDVTSIEPSDLELASRYVAWTLMPIGALAIFIIGLQ